MSRLKYFRIFKNTSFLSYQHINYSRIHYSSTTCKESKPNLKTLLDNSTSFSERNPPADEWHTPVYPQKHRLQSEKSIRLKVDPRSTSVILFPGQGCQYVGMAKKLLSYPNVKDMFDCASEILRYDLLDLCLNGPEDMLNMTVHSQVAVMVSSLAAVEKLRADAEKMIENCAATAGLSVGEYAALVFAGALDFENAVRLLKIRGEAMQAASDLEPGGMMTVFTEPGAKIKMACQAAREWCLEQTTYNAECSVAMYLCPGGKVVSGHIEALKFLESNAAKFRIKGNQTPTMDQMKKKLAEQLCNPIEWEQIMHIMFERPQGEKFPNVYECGPGTSMKSMLKLNNNTAYKNCENVLA
ncbi:hypothetical protein JTE90_026192 [Oedothorax gibbosus]|uniref:Malonyl-CoA:ACP transacylase (MAT) domain-containing protein n=2 Tax=Oedothorax gibbosus TaxID=931172 RepID=A0AAV6U0D7_9ARAC|nr:hypothetical protein JTE90_026192 [Oedothorax gibbosus]